MKMRLGAFILPSAGASPEQFERGFAGQNPNYYQRGLGYVWTRWHDWFGFNEALRRPGETGPIPNTPDSVRERGYSICGSVDTVVRRLAAMIETLNTDLIVPWIAAGRAPLDGLLKSNELLVEKVLPKLGVELTRFKPRLRADYDGRGWRTLQESPP